MKTSKFQHPGSGETSTSNRPSAQFNAPRWCLKLGASLVVGAWCLVLFSVSNASAQSYSINWYKVAGGGGTSTNGQYSLSGTIGQPDASGALTGGNYSLTGGFWALYSVAQTPGAPTLYITISGNTVTVYWQSVSGWVLQDTSSLTPPVSWTQNNNWLPSNGTNYLTITPPAGNEFFRLAP